MPAGQRQSLGRLGEELAAQRLAEQGCQVLQRNARLPEGEIDLVARDLQGCIVFVEVKTRRIGPGGDSRLPRRESGPVIASGAKQTPLPAETASQARSDSGRSDSGPIRGAVDDPTWPEQGVTPAKRRRLRRAALAYLAAHPELGEEWRVDVIAVSLYPGLPAEIVHYENAVEDEIEN
jgi:Holliday junction resolvase-like predicted endonuclease